MKIGVRSGALVLALGLFGTATALAAGPIFLKIDGSDGESTKRTTRARSRCRASAGASPGPLPGRASPARRGPRSVRSHREAHRQVLAQARSGVRNGRTHPQGHPRVELHEVRAPRRRHLFVPERRRDRDRCLQLRQHVIQVLGDACRRRRQGCWSRRNSRLSSFFCSRGGDPRRPSLRCSGVGGRPHSHSLGPADPAPRGCVAAVAGSSWRGSPPRSYPATCGPPRPHRRRRSWSRGTVPVPGRA